MKNLHINKTTMLGVFASSLLVSASAIYFYSPTFGSHADTSKSAEVSLTVGSALALSTSADSLALEANIGDFAHGSIDVDIVTNSQYGYTLTLEDSDSESSLVHTNPSISDKLTSEFEGAKTSSVMDNNTWGFSLDTTDYYYIPTLGNPAALKRTTGAVSRDYDRTSVDFGAKVGNITSGTYTDTVKFTAYVNGVDGNPEDGTKPNEPGTVNEPAVGIHSITDMQDITSDICAETTTPNVDATKLDWDGTHHDDKTYVPRVKLTDTRDNKTYLVSKLADGNCWMSQNLALDLTADTAIVISNNDGTTGTWTPTNSTQTTTGITWEQPGTSARSYKPQSGEDYYQAGTTMAGSPSDTGDAYDWEKTGNYYNWYAATAGTGTSTLRSTEAGSSICPKGWRLPPRASNKSFTNLITNTYGLAGAEEETFAIRANPLNFTLSGTYSYNSRGMYSQGVSGFYWSSSADSYATRAYSFFFATFTISPNAGANKGSGYSVRCVAR